MYEDDSIIASVKLEVPLGFKVESKVVGIKQSPRYYKIGNGVRNTFMKNEEKYIAIDAIKAMSEMSPQELWFINLLKDNVVLIEERADRGYKLRTSAKSIVLSNTLSKSEKQKLKVAYRRLSEKNLVKRIKRQHYMLNPNFFIPYFYQDEVDEYNNL